MCGSADGELAPVYVVYKAEKMWTENEPNNCRYNLTKSGWFDFNALKTGSQAQWSQKPKGKSNYW